MRFFICLSALVMLALVASPVVAQEMPSIVKGDQLQKLQSSDTPESSQITDAPVTATTDQAVLTQGDMSVSLNKPHGTAPTRGGTSVDKTGLNTRLNEGTVGPYWGSGETGKNRIYQSVSGYMTQVGAYGGRFLVAGNATDNSIVGAIVQDGSNGNSFPTGVTGYALMNNARNQAFGMFSRADLGINGGSAVSGTAVGHEMNCFNYSGAPSTSLPPDLSFGTTQKNCIPLQVVAYGNYNSSIGINMAGGGATEKFQTGLYFHPQSTVNAAIMVDATSANSASYAAILKATTAAIPLELQSLGTIANQNPVLIVADNEGAARAAIKQIGDVYGRSIVSTGLSAPAITTCSGIGKGGACALDAGSGDGGGTIAITAGSSAIATGGTITLTFSSALGPNGAACQVQHATNWLSNTSLSISAQSATSFSFTYLNGGGTGIAFTNGKVYRVNYFCIGR
jgi:hypothetical protein